MRRGLMIVLSSPSGAGKSTLARALMQEDHGVVPSISCTTRGRRPSEAHGVHYLFVDEREFEAKRKSGDLLEWARVHGNLYGTPKAPVDASLSAGLDVVFDIDWQGTESLYEAMPHDIVSVFVLPPSAEELQARLSRRAEDEPDVIRRRLSNAREEIMHWSAYDHVIVNRDFGATYDALKSIIAGARSWRERGGEKPSKVRPADVEALIDDLDAGLASLDPEAEDVAQLSLAFAHA